mmetsp:Transcript_994/g.1603  ORF Transcript_994/g.1603 Transcript_994/m.1603 type:complete len:201 (+) Transcript_994:724-1326(+)
MHGGTHVGERSTITNSVGDFKSFLPSVRDRGVLEDFFEAFVRHREKVKNVWESGQLVESKNEKIFKGIALRCFHLLNLVGDGRKSQKLLSENFNCRNFKDLVVVYTLALLSCHQRKKPCERDIRKGSTNAREGVALILKVILVHRIIQLHSLTELCETRFRIPSIDLQHAFPSTSKFLRHLDILLLTLLLHHQVRLTEIL